ncbi:MAG TPA: DUF6585 family protein, partial [Ktedonobacteraceae bacterium]|nr:DUF6585 family protein [Ktedonobacteraceae bacterium]
MSTQLQPDSNIPPQVYELAAMRGVGSPLKRRRRKLIQVFLIIILLLAIALLGWLGYNIYGYIAFLIISQTYPSVESVPDNQLDTYLWLQTLHDGFWLFLLQFIGMLLSLFGSAFTFLEAYRAKLYICTDGLLKIYGKKDEAVRWDEVKEFYTINGTIIRLVKQDGSKISLPHLLMGGRDKSFNTFISDEVTRCLLPELLTRYDRGETINFSGLKVSLQGISWSGSIIYWGWLGDIVQEK